MRKILAPLTFAAALLFSPLALADVSEETWAQLEGQPVLLTNPQGKEIRGTLLDADGDTIRIERADGTVVTVGKSEVESARSLAVGSTTRKADPSESSETPSTSEETVGATERKDAQGGEAKDAGESTRKDAPPADSPPDSRTDTPKTEAQDAVMGEVDGRAAAQQESIMGPTAVSAGLGLASGAGVGLALGGGCTACCLPGACVIAAPIFYGVRSPPVYVEGSDQYVNAYTTAYQSELKRRRLIWTSVGAAGGFIVGATTLTVAGMVLGGSTSPIPNQTI